jgi:hypothetical protein
LQARGRDDDSARVSQPENIATRFDFNQPSSFKMRRECRFTLTDVLVLTAIIMLIVCVALPRRVVPSKRTHSAFGQRVLATSTRMIQLAEKACGPVR